MIDPHRVLALVVLNHDLLRLAAVMAPLIAGIVIVGIVLAVIQGAFQFEDGALAMGAKLVVVLLMIGSSGMMIYLTIRGIAYHAIADAPSLITRHWN
jgi:flagellar biosynthesis protein FliQ